MIAAWSFGKALASVGWWHIEGIAFYEASIFLLIALVLALRSFQLDDRIAARA
jgi:hypothetical protein